VQVYCYSLRFPDFNSVEKVAVGGVQVQHNPCENWVNGRAYCAQENTGFVQDRCTSTNIVCSKATTSVPSALHFKL
jgi:hypothetical protein